MKYFIKSSAKVLVDYSITLLLFAVFMYVFMSIAGDKHFNTYLSVYCMLMFLLGFFIIYSDMKGLAIKEKRPQYNLNPYPVKGLLYGLVGFLPIILIEIISVIVVLPTEFGERIKELFINTLMGPPYFIIRFANEAVWGYALASLTIPLIAMLGYLAGYYGFEINRKKKMQQIEAREATFKKSPWNPSSNVKSKDGRGKKKAKANKQ